MSFLREAFKYIGFALIVIAAYNLGLSLRDHEEYVLIGAIVGFVGLVWAMANEISKGQ